MLHKQRKRKNILAFLWQKLELVHGIDLKERIHKSCKQIADINVNKYIRNVLEILMIMFLIKNML